MKTTFENQNYNSPLHSEREGNLMISRLLEGGVPFLAARSGGNECETVSSILLHKKTCNDGLKRSLFTTAGVVPVDDETLSKFAVCYSESIKSVDLMGVWAVQDYDWLVNTYCPNAFLAKLAGLEPYYFPDDPWSSRLRGKTVLVIHPFEKSILNNYSKRSLLFPSADILPEFELKTFKTHQNQSKEGADFFESLDKMQDQIGSIDFDVAIIGCGGYGLPIAAFVKNQMNKTALHLGGAVQLMFGIMGKRWESNAGIMRFFNDNWTRPLPEETHSNYKFSEGGCYW
jgi:hypothetical protein